MKKKKHLCSFCGDRFFSMRLRFKHAKHCKEKRWRKQ